MSSIQKVQVGNTTYNITASTLASCSTAADTSAKVVALDGFVLNTGATIPIMFSNGNSSSSVTLNVNSTGAKTCLGMGSVSADGVVTVVYDGTNWKVSQYGFNVSSITCSESSSTTTAAPIGTITSITITKV